MRRVVFCIYMLGILGFPFSVLLGQADSIPLQILDDVTVSVARLEAPVYRIPMAVTSIQVSRLANTYQQLSLQEYLLEVPGLLTTNANNFAQDLRISIRGFGARSAFGIRGVKLVVDGVPETTPDGQGQVDNLDLGIMDRIEVLRGASSGLYGNASGGVISIHTLDRLSANFLEVGATLGAYGMQRYQVRGGLAGKRTDAIVNAAWVTSDGYRQHSQMQQAIVSANVIHRVSDKATLKLRTSYTDSPRANDPGGITGQAVEMDRRQAHPGNIDFQAGEAIQQFKASLTFDHTSLLGGQVQSLMYYSVRDLFSYQPFFGNGTIDLGRQYGGHSTTYTLPQRLLGGNSRLQLGYEWHFQRDERTRYDNDMGEPGELTFQQLEQFSNLGVFSLLEWTRFDWAVVQANIRYDYNRLEGTDQFLDNGDDSGRVDLPAFSGGLSLGFPIKAAFNPYLRLSTSFETPTLNELSNNPFGNEGFNEALLPQKARSAEVGVKGSIRAQVRYEVAAFYIRTLDEILPYNNRLFPGLTFYENAGETHRVGIEASVQYVFWQHWYAAASLTQGRFTFADAKAGTPAAVWDGNLLPGIPNGNGTLSIRYAKPRGWLLQAQAQFRSNLYTDNDNTQQDPAYTLVQLKVGREIPTSNNTELTGYIGVNNLTNARYNDNVRINAFGGRYFEPAPPRHIYFGVKWRRNSTKIK